MTTIERARKFCERIIRWAGEPRIRFRIRHKYFGWHDQTMMWCQARVARALIRQRMLEVNNDCDEMCDCIGPCYKAKGLNEALDILDAVYGRRGHD